MMRCAGNRCRNERENEHEEPAVGQLSKAPDAAALLLKGAPPPLSLLPVTAHPSHPKQEEGVERVDDLGIRKTRPLDGALVCPTRLKRKKKDRQTDREKWSDLKREMRTSRRRRSGGGARTR